MIANRINRHLPITHKWHEKSVKPICASTNSINVINPQLPISHKWPEKSVRQSQVSESSLYVPPFSHSRAIISEIGQQ